jgi:hypothetical protein
LGRFISEDPAANSNLYIYGNNNPLSYIDPDGRNPFLIAMAIGALFGGIDAVCNGGNFWTGAFVGAVSGAIGYGFGQALAGTALANALGPIGTQALTIGLTSGTMSSLMGGDFWDAAGRGVLSGAISAWLSNKIPEIDIKNPEYIFLAPIRNLFVKTFGQLGAYGKASIGFSDILSAFGINLEDNLIGKVKVEPATKAEIKALNLDPDANTKVTKIINKDGSFTYSIEFYDEKGDIFFVRQEYFSKDKKWQGYSSSRVKETGDYTPYIETRVYDSNMGLKAIVNAYPDNRQNSKEVWTEKKLLSQLSRLTIAQSNLCYIALGGKLIPRIGNFIPKKIAPNPWLTVINFFFFYPEEVE